MYAVPISALDRRCTIHLRKPNSSPAGSTIDRTHRLNLVTLFKLVGLIYADCIIPHGPRLFANVKFFSVLGIGGCE